MSKNLHLLGQAREDEFFKKRNKEAVERLETRLKEPPRLSPITGKPMEQLTYMGVVIDRCPESGGIWLDKGELEEIITTAKMVSEAQEEKHNNWIEEFFGYLTGTAE